MLLGFLLAGLKALGASVIDRLFGPDPLAKDYRATNGCRRDCSCRRK